MLHAGLDLSRKKLDVCLLSHGAEIVEEFPAPRDVDGLRGLARPVRSRREPVRGVIESMTGGDFVHDRLKELGRNVVIADAAKVKGLAPLACKTDKIDARVLALLSQRDLLPGFRALQSFVWKSSQRKSGSPLDLWVNHATARRPLGTWPAPLPA